MTKKMTNCPSDGVKVPEATVEDSRIKKRQHRTLRQLPLYRDMSNLKYYVVRIYDGLPRKYTKYIDSVLNTVCEAKKCVGLSEASRNPDERASYLTMARAFVEDVQDDITILRKLNQIDGDTEKKMKSLARGIVAQCVAWRDYENRQGASGID